MICDLALVSQPIKFLGGQLEVKVEIHKNNIDVFISAPKKPAMN